jgi:hypothetical protein
MENLEETLTAEDITTELLKIMDQFSNHTGSESGSEKKKQKKKAKTIEKLSKKIAKKQPKTKKNNKLKQLLQCSGVDDQEEEEKDEEKDDGQLILDYNYFIDEGQTKFIASVGFRAREALDSVVSLTQHNVHVYINSEDLNSLFHKYEEINNYFSKTAKTQHKKTILHVNDTCKIEVHVSKLLKLPTLSISNGGSAVFISKSGWEHLLNLWEYLDMVIQRNDACRSDLKFYFNEYISRCLMRKKNQLTQNEFFTPLKSKVHHELNLYRFYTEIPIKMKQDLARLIAYRTENKCAMFTNF